jgi:hypothetical protein
MHQASTVEKLIKATDTILIEANQFFLTNRGTTPVRINGIYTLAPKESYGYPSLGPLTVYKTQIAVEFQGEGENGLVVQTTKVAPNLSLLRAQAGQSDFNIESLT